MHSVAIIMIFDKVKFWATRLDYCTYLYLFDDKVTVTQEVLFNRNRNLLFNNNALKKCTNSKAFYTVARVSAQFFASLI